MNEKDQSLYSLLDLLISEYGWSLDYVLKLPHDIVKKLVKVINDRQKRQLQVKTKLMALAVNCGFNGKLDKLDNLFNENYDPNEEIDPNVWKGQVKSLWMRTKSNGKNLSADEFKNLTDTFEAEWKKGNITF